MKTPDATPDSAPASPGHTRADAPSSRPERARLFTPMDSGGSRRPKGLHRLIGGRTGPSQELDPHIDPQTAQTSHPSHPPGSPRPPLVPNTTVTFLEDVYTHISPEKIERRLSRAAQATGIASLAAAVVFVLGSVIHLSQPAAPASAAIPQPATPEPAGLSPAETAETVAAGQRALESFLAHHSKPTPTPAGAPSHDATANPLDPQPRLLQAGTLPVVLVPLQNPSGVPHTAAVIGDTHGWQVDERSAITPETMPWNDFVAAPPLNPQLFRVLLSRTPSGAWSAIRPHDPHPHPVPLTINPGSRLEHDLASALARHPGRPLAADLFLQADPALSLHVVGWTPDKWAL